MKKAVKIKKITDEEIRKLVLERLKILSSDKKISVGSEGDFSKDELIACVKKNDEIGKKIVQAQLSYLRALKTGELLDEE